MYKKKGYVEEEEEILKVELRETMETSRMKIRRKRR